LYNSSTVHTIIGHHYREAVNVLRAVHETVLFLILKACSILGTLQHYIIFVKTCHICEIVLKFVYFTA